MRFLDKRTDKSKPVSEDLLKLKDEIVKLMQGHQHYDNCVISVNDFELANPLFTNRQHLAMNFEPNLSDAFRDEWRRISSKRIVSQLIENTEWKRYAWGVYLD